MQRRLLLYTDSVYYDSEKNETIVNGWGIETRRKVPLVPAEDSKLIKRFQSLPRPDIIKLYEVNEPLNFGFNVVLDGDYRKKDFNLEFRSALDDEDTEYTIPLDEPKKQAFKKRIKQTIHSIGKRDSVEEVKNEEEEADSDKLDGVDLTSLPTTGPLISIVTPVYNIKIKWLRDFINSILNQTYQNWELCLADDCSTDPAVRTTLEEYMEKDSRIKVVFREKNGHISAATNSAIAIASGEFIAFMDDDDTLDSYALAFVAQTFLSDPQIDLVYTDEDKMSESGEFYDAFYKPGWSPVLLDFHNYVNHLTVVRKSVLDAAGHLDGAYNGSQDYELLKRIIQKSRKIEHIPYVLYHWRAVAGSVAENPEAKLYAYESAIRGIEDTYASQGIRASVEQRSRLGTYKVSIEPETWPSVSLIIVGKYGSDPAMRDVCSKIILKKTEYPDFEIILFNASETIIDPKIRKYYDTAPREESYLRNYAASKANGDIIVFLDENLRPKQTDWLKVLVNQLKRKSVGIAGPRIISNTGEIIHQGISIFNGIRVPTYRNLHIFDTDYFSSMNSPREVFAVSYTCMGIKKELFDQLGGFDDALPEQEQEIKLSIDARDLGYETVLDPDAVMICDLPQKDGEEKLENIQKLYAPSKLVDPYFNPKMLKLELERQKIEVSE